MISSNSSNASAPPLDWSRTKFTLGDRNDPDDKMAEAITKAFVDLYE